MKLYKLGILLGILLLFTGCSSLQTASVNEAIQSQTITYSEDLKPNPEAESILVNAFAESEIPWDGNDYKDLVMARSAIQAMGEYLKSKLEFDSSLSYYTYKASFEFIQNQYNTMQNILDKRVALDGSVSNEVRVIYSYVKRDINNRIYKQQLKIAAVENDISSQSVGNTVEELKNLYTVIKPLIDMAL